MEEWIDLLKGIGVSTIVVIVVVVSIRASSSGGTVQWHRNTFVSRFLVSMHSKDMITARKEKARIKPP
jgi:uncharacterized membrane protein